MTKFSQRLKAAALTLALATTVALTGCGSSDKPSSDEKVTITFSYLWAGKEAEGIEKIISNFNSSQDKIVVKGVSNPDMQAQLAAMSSKTGAFDISDHFSGSVAEFASKGLLEPLDAYMEKDDFKTDDFVPAAMAPMKYQDQTYSMPIAIHSFLLFYNKDKFSKAGLSGCPTDSDAWAEAIKKTSVVNGNKIDTLGMASLDTTTTALAFGGQLIDEQGNPTLTHEGNVAAFSFLQDNIIKPYGASNVSKYVSGFGDYASPQNPFFSGKVAMTIDGEWLPTFIKQYAPKLNYGVCPVPHLAGKPELANTTQITGSTLFIPKNATHKEEAWVFMKYLLGETGMTDFTKTLGNLPARTSLLDSDAYADLPNFDDFMKAAKSENAKAVNPSERASLITAALGEAQTAVNLGKKEAKVALEDAQKTLE